VCVPLDVETLVPSPQSRTVLCMSLLTSLQFPVAVTFSGATPLLGATVSVQVGGVLLPTVIVIGGAEPVKPPASVAVRVMVKVPTVR
jgi:hypothetical protein